MVWAIQAGSGRNTDSASGREGFSHSVGLWTFDGRPSRFKTDVARVSPAIAAKIDCSGCQVSLYFHVGEADGARARAKSWPHCGSLLIASCVAGKAAVFFRPSLTPASCAKQYRIIVTD
jgi:hypothetical protein